MAPPVERDDREPGRQRSRERYKDLDREGTRRHKLRLGPSVSEEGAPKHIEWWAIDTEQERRVAGSSGA